MRFKVILAVSLATSSLVACLATTPARSQSKEDVDRINKWFDKNKEKQKSMDEYFKKKPGEFQKVRKDWQEAGDIQKTRPIEIPKGWDAIAKVKVPCQQRFRVSSDTLFEFDKATLTPYAVQTLGLLLPEFQKYKNHPVKVEGHTDSIGTDEYNQGLSERRAERVFNWLLENELFKKEALTSVGFGEKRPIAPNTNPNGSDNPKGRAQNRRVEIVVNTCVTLDGSEPPEKDPGGAASGGPARPGASGDSPGASGDATPSTDTKASPEASKDATEGDSTAEPKIEGSDANDASNSPSSIREQLESDDSKDPTSGEKPSESKPDAKPADSSSNSSSDSSSKSSESSPEKSSQQAP